MEAADVTYKIVPSVADQGKAMGWDITTGLANSSLLIHSDTTDGSTTFVDTVGTHSPTVGAADVEHDTDQTKFGKTSILFDGNSGYITVPDHADWDFNSGVFTIDFWIMLNSLPANGVAMYFLSQYVGAATLQYFRLYNNAGTYELSFKSVAGGTEVLVTQTWSTPATDTWYHLAVIRGWGGQANDFGITVNGKQIGSTTTDANDAQNIAAALEIGRINIGGAQGWFDGWKDEIRVSKGVTRWPTNFIPPYGSYR